MLKFFRSAVNLLLSPIALLMMNPKLLSFKNIKALATGGLSHYSTVKQAITELKKQKPQDFVLENFAILAEAGGNSIKIVNDFNSCTETERTKLKFEQLCNYYIALEIQHITVNDGAHDGEYSLHIETTDTDYSFSGFCKSLYSRVLSLFGGYGASFEWLKFAPIITKKDNKQEHHPHAMRELCHQALAEHNGLCRIDEIIHDVKTKDGYSDLVTCLFQRAGHSMQIADYEVDSYEAAIPKAHRI